MQNAPLMTCSLHGIWSKIRGSSTVRMHKQYCIYTYLYMYIGIYIWLTLSLPFQPSHMKTLICSSQMLFAAYIRELECGWRPQLECAQRCCTSSLTLFEICGFLFLSYFSCFLVLIRSLNLVLLNMHGPV